MKNLIYILFLVASCNSIPDNVCVSEYIRTQVKPILIKGKIINVSTPELHHGTKVIKLLNYDGKIIQYEQSYRMDQNLFIEVNKDDSILKKVDFLDVIITKPNTVKKIYYFNCPDIKHDTL